VAEIIAEATTATGVSPFSSRNRRRCDAVKLRSAVTATVTIPPEVLTPGAARNIGPGSALLITIPDEGRAIETAHEAGLSLSLGSAS
jgi:hypothetical protein